MGCATARDCGAGGCAVAGEWLRWRRCGWCGGGWEWLVWRWLGVAGGMAGVAEAVVADRVRGRV